MKTGITGEYHMVKKPILLLFILSPVIAELLSGSTPPHEFFNPISFIILVCLYGAGAVIIRELKVLWKVGYCSILLMGMAYGIVEEGIAVKSFYDPFWPDLGIFSTYGRWLGVNWIWAFYLTIYHSVWSITVPIVLVETLYHDKVNSRWISNKGLIIALIIFVADVLFLNVITSYRISYATYLAMLIIIGLIFYFTRKIKPSLKPLDITPRRLHGYTLSWSIMFFLSFYVLPEILKTPLLSIIIALAVGYFSFKLVEKLDSPHVSIIHKAMFAIGPIIVLSSLMLLLALEEPKMREMILVSIASFAGIAIYYNVVKRKVSHETS